jgi:hypothetical protein
MSLRAPEESQRLQLLRPFLGIGSNSHVPAALARLIDFTRIERVRALYFGGERSAGFKVLEQVTAPAFFMFLGVRKPAHENQGRQNTSSHEVLDHGCHSTDLPATAAADRAG